LASRSIPTTQITNDSITDQDLYQFTPKTRMDAQQERQIVQALTQLPEVLKRGVAALEKLTKQLESIDHSRLIENQQQIEAEVEPNAD
jgi:hypothetical protein